MNLQILGSSSKGNGYLLTTSGGEVLIIEAGIGLIEVKKALNFDISKVSGLIVSHEHGDHFGKIHEYIGAGIQCYMGSDTGKMLKKDSHNAHHVPIKKEIMVGSFKILAFPVVHDVPALGYLISHPESGIICFLTDTFYTAFKFPKITHWMIEANYSQEIMDRNIESGRLPEVVRRRTGENHMSLETCKQCLQANDLTDTRNIVLIHLSDGNSNEKDFKKQIQEATGKQTICAEPGMVIEFNKNPF